MARKPIIGALLLVGVGVVLGTTVLRDDIAHATGLAPTPSSVVVVNPPAQAVPTREQNLDGSNIKVHEEGTANVNVTNGSLAVTPAAPITNGGGRVTCAAAVGGNTCPFVPTQTASALSIHMTSGVVAIGLSSGDGFPSVFAGPAPPVNGNDSIVLALARPISFDGVVCFGAAGDVCSVSWTGNSP
jgi:hypothetical protein